MTLLQLGGSQTALGRAQGRRRASGDLYSADYPRREGAGILLDAGYDPGEIRVRGLGHRRQRRLLGGKTDLAARFMRAYVAGIQYGKTHKEESMRITARYMKLDLNKDRASLEETYNIFIQVTRARSDR